MKKDSNNYSADFFIEDYQRQLKKQQGYGVNQNFSSQMEMKKSDLEIDNNDFPDLGASMSHVENQLISQFREYKEIKQKLDDA